MACIRDATALKSVDSAGAIVVVVELFLVDEA